MPDKWNEIAMRLAGELRARHSGPIADALRSAFTEGERAGMERAAEIAGDYPLGRYIAALIRAAKETKEENT